MTVDGHFIFKSGKHATTKLDYERLKRRDQRRAAKQIGALIAEEFPNLDAVVGVANGANRLAEDSAKHVSKLLGRNVLAFTTIKDERTGDFTVKKGNIYVGHKKLVVVDDIFTEGTTTEIVSGLLHKFGAKIVGIATLANRNNRGKNSIPYPHGEQLACNAESYYVPSDEIHVASVYNASMDDYEASDCPWQPECPSGREFFGTQEEWLDNVV